VPTGIETDHSETKMKTVDKKLQKATSKKDANSETQ